MPRPKYCRKIDCLPDVNYFKPKGIPSSSLEEVVLTLDEFEAIKLADLESLYQEQAAFKMNISRPTFGRIIEAAHKKIADALVHGKALKIEGGKVEIGSMIKTRCKNCDHLLRQSLDPEIPTECPKCKFNETYKNRSMENKQ